VQLGYEFEQLQDELVNQSRQPDDQAEQKWRYQPSAVDNDRFDKAFNAGHASSLSTTLDAALSARKFQSASGARTRPHEALTPCVCPHDAILSASAAVFVSSP
jgi:hypothetical protein